MTREEFKQKCRKYVLYDSLEKNKKEELKKIIKTNRTEDLGKIYKPGTSVYRYRGEGKKKYLLSYEYLNDRIRFEIVDEYGLLNVVVMHHRKVLSVLKEVLK